jgi:signal transduction histidine kinase
VSLANIVKRKVVSISQRYQAALRAHLKQSSRASLQVANSLGRQAMANGLETLDLARIHEQALLKLALPNHHSDIRTALVLRAGSFFAQAITPIEETHRVAQESNANMGQLKRALHQRKVELASSRQSLNREITQRKSAEGSLRKSKQHYGRLLAQSQHMQEQLRLLSRQLLLAQEEERKKISRELHDVIAQTLSSINVQLATLKCKAALNTKGLERTIDRTQRLVVRSVDIVHRFARELRPTVLDDLGLIPALSTFLKGFAKKTGIRVSLTCFSGVEAVNGDKRTVLYRVVQEALTNVARHAEASHAQVNIQKLDGAVCMQITDDGKGFQSNGILRPKKTKRLGLLGMRERLEMVGGLFHVASTPGKGTTILAKIPVVIDGREEKPQ